MKAIILKLTLVVLFFTTVTFSQDKTNPGVRLEYPKHGLVKSAGIDPKVERIQQEMLQAKIANNVSEVMRLQNELDKLTGSVTVRVQDDPSVKYITASNPPFQGSDYTINVIRVLQRSGIRSIAAATEQRGATAGRIWVAATVAGAGNTNDTLWILYSSDNGTSWFFGGGAIYLNSRYADDELDMEIIEDNAGTKYVWVIAGRIEGTQRYVSGIILASTSTISSFTLSFPGTASSDRYYRPRITSDNAQFAPNAWIYIVACKDSVGGPGYINTERTVICYNPYTNMPTLTYKPNQFSFSTASNQPQSNFCDIAYYRNSGGDSIIMIKTGPMIVIDSTRINLKKCAISGFVSATVYPHAGDIQGAARSKFGGRIASNGGYPNLMIVCVEKFSQNDWDIPYFGSNNGGASWTSGYLDFTTVFSTSPDITGRRNTMGKFYTAFTNLNSTPGFHNVVISTSVNGVWGSLVQPVNHISAAAGLVSAGPQAGIRFVSNDSCFTIWSESTGGAGNNVWASNGCTPPLVSGIPGKNNQLPQDYLLEQNYPNPFNPVTNIRFAIPKAGMVKLVVYDLNGREVNTIVNQRLNAGNYTVDFDASAYASGVYLYRLLADDFVDVKKMVLIR